MSLWLAIARTQSADDVAHGSLPALLAFTASVDDRLATAGVAGMSGAIDVHGTLARVLAAVDVERIAALRAAVADLERELARAAAVLARLRAVKQALEASAPGLR